MSDNPALLCERRGGLTILQLNQPDRMNALSAEMKEILAREVQEFITDQSARCLMITGNEKAFCAGGDVRNMVGEQSTCTIRARLTTSHEAWARHLLMGEKPVIMAVSGPAVGAGFALAMLGDIVIASDSAYFSAGFSAIGVAADMGLGVTLPRMVGLQRAKDILFTNRRVSAQEALSIGMVSNVTTPDMLIPTALALGERLAEGATVGIGLTKMLLNMGYEESLTTFLQTESLVQAIAFSTADREEGAAAFLERRKPRFSGR